MPISWTPSPGLLWTVAAKIKECGPGDGRPEGRLSINCGAGRMSDAATTIVNVYFRVCGHIGIMSVIGQKVKTGARSETIRVFSLRRSDLKIGAQEEQYSASRWTLDVRGPLRLGTPFTYIKQG